MKINMSDVYIVSACRTPLGSFNGQFSKIPATELGSVVIRNCLERVKISGNEVSEVIMGHVLTAGQGQNPARQSSIGAGIPVQVPAYTINMLCGSGLKTVYLGYQAISNGEAAIVVCGGQENMTLAPHCTYLRNGARLTGLELKDTVVVDGLTDVFNNVHMGETAEHLAVKYKISREEQDQFAYDSQLKAAKALTEGYFVNEIVPVVDPVKGTVYVKDEYIKPDICYERLSKLRTIFVKDPTKNPSVTAGNSSGINDGAAAVLLCNQEQVQDRKLQPLAKIVAFAQTGLEPMDMGLGPVKAVQEVLKKAKWTEDEVDLYEINEAFASQSLAVLKELGLDSSKVNVTGGAIAIGHPLGASGARILVTLLFNLQRLGLQKGVASLCIGGGMGIAIAVERVRRQ